MICLVRAVIHELIKPKGITTTKRRVSIAFSGEDVLKDHLRYLGDNLRGLHIFLLDLIVDFLFLIGQEDIDTAIFLNKHLPHQNFQGVLHTAF